MFADEITQNYNQFLFGNFSTCNRMFSMITLKHFSKLTITAVVSFVMASNSVNACTSFLLQAKDGTPVYGRTLEYGIDTKQSVVVVPRKHVYNPGGVRDDKDDTPGPEWSTRYAFVGVMSGNLPFVSDGMNEMGLAGGSLYFPGSVGYAQADGAHPNKTFAPWEFLSWVLSNFATVAEVKAGLSDVKIVGLNILSPKDGQLPPEMNFLLPYHFPFHDASGASIVIEPVDGVLKVYDNPLGVLTNSPSFDWHLTNVRNYLKMSSAPAAPLTIKGPPFVAFGLGSGMLGLPGDSTPPSRFIRAVAYVATTLQLPAEQLKDGPQAVKLAEHILNNFDLPNGYVDTGSPQGEFEITQWSSIADLRAKKYYIKTYEDQTLREVDLTKINLGGKDLLISPLSTHQTIPPIKFQAP
jgi:choloylglycine hydrolase